VESGNIPLSDYENRVKNFRAFKWDFLFAETGKSILG
jgi:hypothetical protein